MDTYVQYMCAEVHARTYQDAQKDALRSGKILHKGGKEKKKEKKKRKATLGRYRSFLPRGVRGGGGSGRGMVVI